MPRYYSYKAFKQAVEMAITKVLLLMSEHRLCAGGHLRGNNITIHIFNIILLYLILILPTPIFFLKKKYVYGT
jgi:hypothetical protein